MLKINSSKAQILITLKSIAQEMKYKIVAESPNIIYFKCSKTFSVPGLPNHISFIITEFND
jgi:hypothetical protein